MACNQTKMLEEFLDERLDPKSRIRFQNHLEICQECRTDLADVEWMRTLLAGKHRLSSSVSDRLFSRMQKRTNWSCVQAARDWFGRVYAYYRDLEPLTVATKLASVPLSLGLLVLLLTEFPSLGVWTSPVLELPYPDLPAQGITQVHVHQDRTKIPALVEKLLNLQEDRVSLVANISPQGQAEIGYLLTPPRDYALMEAVDLAFEGSYFSDAKELINPVLIYSLQTIDVLEGE